jgi:hypothetical protein
MSKGGSIPTWMCVEACHDVRMIGGTTVLDGMAELSLRYRMLRESGILMARKRDAGLTRGQTAGDSPFSNSVLPRRQLSG